MDANVRKLPDTPTPARMRKKPAKVLMMSTLTRLNVPPDRVLRSAVGKLESVLVLGFDKEGEFYAAASHADGGDALWLMELCKRKLLEMT